MIIVPAHHFGGHLVYLPQEDKLRAAVRDAEIWRNPDRLSVRALAARHSLSARQIYGILRKQRACASAAKRQHRIGPKNQTEHC